MGCGCGNRAIRRPEAAKASTRERPAAAATGRVANPIVGTWNGPKSRQRAT